MGRRQACPGTVYGASALLLLAPRGVAAVARQGLHLGLRISNPVLDTPDLTAYDPTEVLCTKGRDEHGNPKIQGWCKDWLACIKAGAEPAGDAAAVRAAWKPADCREVCGLWPATTRREGTSVLLAQRALAPTARLQTSSSARLAKLYGVRVNGTVGDCQTSCSNFQESLTECVAMILFEPGQVAAMGIPEDGPTAPPPVYCRGEHTECVPDLQLQYQSCLTKTHEPSECKVLKTAVEGCKDCPQLSENYMSHYHAFVVGCMDQLNAYWQATNPAAGEAAILGATGCMVH